MTAKTIIKIIFIILTFLLLLAMKSNKGQEFMKNNKTTTDLLTGIYFFIGGAILFGL
jgi:hypothetical protein